MGNGSRVGLALVILTVVACAGTSGEVGTPTTVTSTGAEPATSTTLIVEPTTTTRVITTADFDESVSIAVAYLEAEAARDLEAASRYTESDTVFDWGPRENRETLGEAWAWEDAFTVSHSLDRCQHVDSANAEQVVARCWLLVESEVAAAAGKEAGYVCLDLAVHEGAIKRVSVLNAAEGCSLNYWAYMIGPFGHWLADAHPETTIEEMYDDRTSAEGLALWVEYTEEYLADRGASG